MKTNFADVKPTFQGESDTIGINDARNRTHDLLAFNLAQRLLPENQMRKSNFWITAQVFVVSVFVACPIHSRSQVEKTPYPAMAPLDQYLIPNQNAEIALARSAAPPSIADSATVMVLGRKGYTIAAKGSNGFLCYVERSWAEDTDAPDFWNPKLRAPNCFNRPAARSVTQIYLMKTGLVLAGKSKAEIAQAIAAALNRKELHAPAPGAMCYMMSKQQYLGDRDRSWRPHLMFYGAGEAAKSWGANLPGSPMLASYDPQARVTTFMVVVHDWSDGTPGPPMEH